MIEAVLITLSVLLFFIFIFGGWIVGCYNLFVRLSQDIKNQFSNIKTEYQRRADLFVNLAESVKSYAKFEKSTMKEVIAMRSGIKDGKKQLDNPKQTKKQAFQGMMGLDNLFNGLKVVFERYPDLKAVEQFNKLFEEVRITEDRINVARTDYNGIVKDYNVAVSEFPKRIIAGMFNYNHEEYFENEETSNKAPKIELS